MPILLAAAFWLVVTVGGVVKHEVGPMTGEACVLQMAFRIVQMERLEDAGVRMVIGGRVVKRGDVEIACLPGERAT